MTKDLNKDIFNIDYKHLNLPTKIMFEGAVIGANKNITYTYDATGVKLKKTIRPGMTADLNGITLSLPQKHTEYDGSFIYEHTGTANPELKFFSHPEGYFEPTGTSPLGEMEGAYVYQCKDHSCLRRLTEVRRDGEEGTVRLSYKDTNNNGDVSSSEIMEENNYYPFGLKHKGYNNVVNGTEIKYGFIGKEEQDELDLDWIDFGWRNYNPAVGRFVSIDQHSESYYSHTTYNYAGSSPLVIFDLGGMDWYTDKEGNYNFDPDLNKDNAETFFKSKDFEYAKYAFASATIKSGKGLDKETNEFEELLSSFTLNDDGSVTDNIVEDVLDDGEIVDTAGGTRITAYDEDHYTPYDVWVKQSGEGDPAVVLQGLKAVGVGAGIEKLTTKKQLKTLVSTCYFWCG